MKFDEFTGHVQHRARLASTDEVLKATRGVLHVLGDRLQGGAADKIAGQLPSEIKEFLADRGPGESFDLDEFHRRVGEEEGVDLPDAVHHARAVLSVVDQASQGLLRKEWDQLPADYDRLLAEIEEFETTYQT